MSTSPPPPPHPLYNTTYTLHTLTPLHSFPPSTPTDLSAHARRLLQQLRGATLRGVTLPPSAQETTQLTRAGALQTCTWTSLPPPGRDGVRIDLVYENATYTALLLEGSSDGPPGFRCFPLMMTRMPSSLRAVVLRYLAAAFDTLPLPLELPDRLLRRATDAYVDATRGGGGKDVVLGFAPLGGAPALKRVGITIPAEDVEGFWRRRGEGGFLAALGGYVESAMGMRVGEVALVKVALGGFVLAAEGKAKLCGDDEAVEEVFGLVLEEAEGRGKWREDR